MTREQTVGIGSGGLPVTDVVLALGPHHPSTHGTLRLALRLAEDRIVSAEPLVGYMHRGAEKLFEVRDYRQIIMLANRHDWLSAFSNELGVALAVERMMGLEVPTRATWLRTLLAELNRVLSHLMFLGSNPLGPTALSPAMQGRETLQHLLEQACGGRMHYMFNRVGGLKEDVPAGWLGRVGAAVEVLRCDLTRMGVDLLGDERFLAGTQGLGVLTPDVARSFGVSGPVARASGLDMDLRRDQPYLAYADLRFGVDFPVTLGTAGDCLARFRCLLDQALVSLDVAQACLERMPVGPVNVKLPKTVKAPEGQVYSATENPLGRQGYYLVSRGERTPWRLAMRTASFNNVSSLTALLPGLALADLVAVLASMFFVVGDVDK